MVNQPAGFWIRLGAGILDSLIIALPVMVIANTFRVDGESLSSLMQLLYGLIVPVIWYGYTVGKRICGIRIVKLDGSNVGIGTMLLRDIVAGFVYVITLGIAVIVSGFMVIFRQDKRSLHDMIAQTYVTYQSPEETMQATLERE